MDDSTKALAPDPDSVVDSVVSEYAWASDRLTYGLTASDIDGDGIDDFDEGNWRAFYASMFAGLSTFTPLTFTETDADRALLNQILFSGSGGSSFEPFPGLTQTGTEVGISGTAASASAAVFLGQYSNTWLHEIGHSLGLRHTFEAPDEIDDGVQDAGDPGTHFLNSSLYSVMSYSGTVWGEDNPWTAAYDPGQTVLNANLGSYGPIDVAALQHIYGAKAHDSGDDVYTFGDDKAADEGYTTIWDTGGDDTIQYVGSSRSKIDLRAATLRKEIGGGGFLSTSETLTGGFLIANGVTIENAIGGSGDDIIVGNAAANTLTGNAGHDTLTGGGGEDVFKDTLADHDGDTITDFTSLDTIWFTDATLGGFASAYDASTGRLTFSDGTTGSFGLSLSSGLSGPFVATSDPSGGVDLRLTTPTGPAVTIPAPTAAAPAPTTRAAPTAAAPAPASPGAGVPASVGGAAPDPAASAGQVASGGRETAPAAAVPGASAPTAAAPVDAIVIDPSLAYAGDGAFVFTGHASSTAGVSGVVISAEVDGTRQDLGSATLAPDGAFSFTDTVGDPQSFIVATLTDGVGGQARAEAGNSLKNLPEGGPFVSEVDGYDAEGVASVSLVREDGSRRVNVLAGGQALSSSSFDTFLDHGAADNTFVFDPGFGLDVVRQFRLGGPGQDTLALPGADFGGSVAEVLRNSRMAGNALAIVDPVSGDTIRLPGITKRELRAHPAAVTFHG